MNNAKIEIGLDELIGRVEMCETDITLVRNGQEELIPWDKILYRVELEKINRLHYILDTGAIEVELENEVIQLYI